MYQNKITICLHAQLTACRREEMMSYKHEALRRQTRSKVKKREELQAKVQSIVAGVEVSVCNMGDSAAV